MNFKVFFGVSAVFLFLGCTEQKESEISANISTSPRSDLEELIFEKGFSSPEYLESVRSAVLDIQVGQAVETAIQKKTPESCDRIPDEYLRKNCRDTMMTTKAIAENDEKWCKEIYDRPSQIGCLDKMANLDATQTGDDKKCDRIVDEKMKKDCVVTAIIQRAVLDLDPVPCRRLEDEGARDFCLGEVKNKTQK